MNLKLATEIYLNDIREFLDLIQDEEYQLPLDIFSGSSIGMHIRHTIEFFQCLIEQSDSGIINYDKRIRNNLIEEQTEFASMKIDQIIEGIKDVDLAQDLKIEVCYDQNEDLFECVDTNMSREIIYNLEHAIHHLALVKIGFKVLKPHVKLPKHFGVAPSTLKFETSCAP